MKKKYYSLFLVGMILFSGCQSLEHASIEKFPSLIPKPQQLDKKEGVYLIDKNTTVFFEEEFTIGGEFLINYIQNGSGFIVQKASKEKADVRIKKNSSLVTEGYTLEISDSGIIIHAKDASGAFYGVQTLRQLMPLSLEKQDRLEKEVISVPQVFILDAPAFKYRGMHLDVGRHFFPKKFIKEYIAQMAMLKMNYFHWHLTEDQGWRIEIKQYPKLTEIGSFRDETLVGHYNDTPVNYDNTIYGGFYTQEDIKEIVAFAQKHQVTIIPEIEMPGHSQASISAYPELGCSGKQVSVATTWGVFENIYCPNENTFQFLENVLTEVIELFPGEYIHIGGDEAPKVNWKKCNHCQQLIKDLDLKNEHGLQSYFIRRMEKFINSKGKKIIGWDEILEGGLAPNATVMSWRGTEGAIAAAKQGHDVILTPTSHAYFDYYQSNNESEPLAIGGFLPLKKVYGFNPIPPELTKEEYKYVLGAQGNVWTEYMKTEDQVEYMVFPRILAMSEVVWSGPSTNIEKDYSNFLSRVESFHQRLDVLDINYANHLYELEGSIINENGELSYQLSTPISGKEIRYTLDGNDVIASSELYQNPIIINNNTTLKSGVFKQGNLVSTIFSENIMYHKAIKGEVFIKPLPHKSYNAGGKQALINGIQGSNKRYGDKEWLGFWGDDLEITIDLGDVKNINKLKTRFYNTTGQWIYAPKRISVSGLIGEKAQFVSSKIIDSSSENNIIEFEIDLSSSKKAQAQILIITLPNYGIIPEGKQGAGNKAWTFIDEIIIE